MKIIKEALIYGFCGVLSRFSAFFTIPIYTRILSKQEYGLLELMVLVSSITFIVAEGQFLSGFVRKYFDYKDNSSRSPLLSSCVTYYALAVTVVFLLVFSKKLIGLIDPRINIYLMIPIVVGLFPNMMIQLTLQHLRMEHNAWVYGLLSLGQVVLNAALGITVVLTTKLGALGILWTIAISQIVFLIVSLIILTREYKIKMEFSEFGDLAKYGYPIMPAVLGNWLLMSIGGIFIARCLSLSTLAIYGVAMKVSGIIMMITLVFRLTWTPYSIKKFTEANSEWFFVTSSKLYSIILIAAVMSVSLLAPLMVMILAPKDYFYAYIYVPVICLAYMWEGTTTILATGNCWAYKTYYNSLGTLAGGVVNVLLIVFFIDRFGVICIPLSFLIGSFIKSIATLYLSQRNHYIPYASSNIVILLLFTIVFCTLNYIPSILLNSLVKIIIGGVFVMAMWMIGLTKEERIMAVHHLYPSELKIMLKQAKSKLIG